jgi:hypothetical protein
MLYEVRKHAAGPFVRGAAFAAERRYAVDLIAHDPILVLEVLAEEEAAAIAARVVLMLIRAEGLVVNVHRVEPFMALGAGRLQVFTVL